MQVRSVWRRGDEGASAVEFAIVFPLLILLVFGILQFGRLLSAYLTVTHLARAGAREAAVGKYEDWLSSDPAPADMAAGTAFSGNDAVPSGSPVTVEVTYTFPDSLTIPGFGNLPIAVSSSATMRRE